MTLVIFASLTQRDRRDTNRNDPGNMFSGHQIQNLSDRNFRKNIFSTCRGQAIS